jgi:hypothetical protein
MDAIDQAVVDRTWEEIRAFPPERAAAEARRFLADQPHVARFLKAHTQEFGAETVGLAVTAALVLVRSLEQARGAPLGTVPAARLDARLRANLAWLEALDAMEPRLLARRLAHGPDLPSPHLAPYLVARLADARVGDGPYADEVRGHLFLLTKTILDSLN